MGHLDRPDLRRLLGSETSYEIDYAVEDFEREREALKRLGI
jgi:hypothetical protein